MTTTQAKLVGGMGQPNSHRLPQNSASNLRDEGIACPADLRMEASAVETAVGHSLPGYQFSALVFVGKVSLLVEICIANL
jgi:hypothetical protein